MVTFQTLNGVLSFVSYIAGIHGLHWLQMRELKSETLPYQFLGIVKLPVDFFCAFLIDS